MFRILLFLLLKLLKALMLTVLCLMLWKAGYWGLSKLNAEHYTVGDTPNGYFLVVIQKKQQYRDYDIIPFTNLKPTDTPYTTPIPPQAYGFVFEKIGDNVYEYSAEQGLGSAIGRYQIVNGKIQPLYYEYVDFARYFLLNLLLAIILTALFNRLLKRFFNI